ncbi:glycosyltransferase [Rhizobacter sp. OV335]|uniref:glycosyltransferase n=1 Tax=Rhizobacter sp. OV335 TaxID=1500264 RepID=UPI00091E04BF|nr:glycosyltransferase [Rhizobacter sp. OV335]SHL95507.1 rhamnosyl/mannosyltransferase [Rhizobacter sp. OV335]
MKILQFSKFYPPVIGGIESVAFELTEGMNKQGVETDVLCAHTGLGTQRERSAAGYRIVRAGSLGKLLSTSMSPALLLETRRMCGDYDVIHVQMPDPMAALALWFARPRAKIVLHWQSDVINQRRALKLYEPLQSWLLRRADAIIATTPPYAEASPALQAWKSKVEVIPLGITPIDSRGAADKAGALRQRFGGRKIVFSLGRMIYYKGFDVLIDAARLLPADAVVVVGGGGELLQTYRDRVAAEGLAGRIEFVGRIPDEDIPGYFEAASVFCLSSIVRAEAYGVVLLEAMAMGKPIVTTDIPGSGVPWVNQHEVTGLNVPVSDGRAMAAALTRILQDDALAARFGAAGKDRFLTQLTAESMVSRTLSLYRRLLAGAVEPRVSPNL